MRSIPIPLARGATLLFAVSLLLPSGCARLRRGEDLARWLPSPPRHDRLWRIEQSVMPYAELDEATVRIRNVRQCRWESDTEKTIRHTDWEVAWDDVQGIDIIVVPFQNLPMLAHTMLSFRLSDGRALVLSVEARLEQGEVYSPVAGAAGQFELIYVLGDEEDLLGLRAVARRDDVYLYPSRATAEEARTLLRDVLQRVNRLQAEPEWYDSLTNNCATNLLDHLSAVLDFDPQVAFSQRIPGQSSDRWVYDMGLIDTDLPFALAREQAWVSGRIRQHIGAPNFSRLIRTKPGTVE